MEEKKQKGRHICKNWLSPEGLLLMRCWAGDGLSMTEIAKKIGVEKATLYLWIEKYPEVKTALYTTREQIDYEVENALFRRAVGYKTEEVKTIIGYAKKDGTRPVRTEKTEIEIPPDVTACLAWLNNRLPDKWKRNRDNFTSAEEEKKNQSVTINIIADKKEGVNVEKEGD